MNPKFARKYFGENFTECLHACANDLLNYDDVVGNSKGLNFASQLDLASQVSSRIRMTTARDEQLHSKICLKQVPSAPLERWKTAAFARSGHKTPERRSRLAVKTPRAKTPCLTPGLTPGLSHRFNKTPSHTTPGVGSSSRYVPNRADMEYSSFLLTQGQGAREGDGGEEDVLDSSGNSDDNQRLLDTLSRSRGQTQKGVLSFRSTPQVSGSHSYMEDYRDSSAFSSRARRTVKLISPQKALDAPTIMDDYYLNTLDWGKNNILAVGLNNSLYLWNASTGNTSLLMELEGREDYISSVSWSSNGKYLAVGDSTACVQLWDAEKQKKIRTMRGHSDRVGVLAWNKHTVASGSRDGLIHYNDVRKPDHVVGRSKYHRDEVCGLEWSRDGTKLASGGNDNLVCLWNRSNPSEPAQVLKGHEAAVKALAWCPWDPNTLATGGGAKDKTIRFWNLFTGQCSKVVPAKSQVSSLQWNKYTRQLISAHGQPRNYMVVWDYPSMTKQSVLSGHSERILNMTISPHKTRVASASTDESIRIWKCFDARQDTQCSYSEESISALLQDTLRT